MSLPTRETSTTIATVWPKGELDEWGVAAFGTPYSLKCTYSMNNGKKFSDTKGVEFIPNAIVWFEQFDTTPKIGDYVSKGDHTETSSPNDVEGSTLIKDVSIDDCSMFGEPDDVRLLA